MKIKSSNSSGDGIPMHSIQSLARESTKLEQEKMGKEGTVSFCSLFRFATSLDYLLMILGTLGAVGVGASLPGFAYSWGVMIGAFVDGEDVVEPAREAMLLFVYLGIGTFVAGWLMNTCWIITGDRQANACRKAYLSSLLKQDVSWFQINNKTQIASNFVVDTVAFQHGISERMGILFIPISAMLVAIIISYLTEWLLAIVVTFAVIPALAIAGKSMQYFISKYEGNSREKYAMASSKTQQALFSIKTVKILNGEQFQAKKYDDCLKQINQSSKKDAFLTGMGYSTIYLSFFGSLAVSFWFGSQCIAGTDHCSEEISGGLYTARDVVIVFFCLLRAGLSLGQLGPSIQKIMAGKQAAYRIYSIIDRQPRIKSPDAAVIIENVQGKVKFEYVTFAYPKQKSRKILDRLNMEFDLNKNAIVGESGSGKSTILQLLMRFYDPDVGRITLDGHDIRDLDLQWLRSLVGYVGQEPFLFAATLRQNFRFAKQDATDQEIIDALRKAQAYDFVLSLKDQLDTYIGEGGNQLSGGQKQRIAIARALLKNPKILLLDEATSALDRKNEKFIQKTLDKVALGKTSITIAHRVTTIMNSDLIYVLENGQVSEKGRFKQLQKYKNEQIKEEAEVEEIQQKKQNDKEELVMKENEEESKLEENKLYEGSIYCRLISYMKNEPFLFIIGTILILINGTFFPLVGFLISKTFYTLVTLQIYPTNQVERKNADDYGLNLFFLALGAFVVVLCEAGLYRMLAAKINIKLRSEAYRKILRMPIPWFDRSQNTSGALVSKLSVDCYQIEDMIALDFCFALQNVSTMISGLAIAFVFDWRTALVGFAFTPLLVMANILSMSFVSNGTANNADIAYRESSQLAMQSMINIKTVLCSCKDEIIAETYERKVRGSEQKLIKNAIIYGFFYGFGKIVYAASNGLLPYIGTLFVRDQGIDIEDMLTATYTIIFMTIAIGETLAFAPNINKGQNSARQIFKILDGVDERQQQRERESKMLTQGLEGDIVFDKVSFKYEGRKEILFQDLSLQIKEGSKVALVGSSGCGKSTIVQMLLGFYSPHQGSIQIGGKNLSDFDLEYLRNYFGVVSQQPHLFNASFKENIQYNLKVTEEEIRDAAAKANAMSFIEGREELLGDLQTEDENKQGFDRSVGLRGSHISGGQKQRVAIARAVVRQPRALLLDQATSALDSFNEKKVQDSLDKLMKDKTTITVAHRINTIKNSDCIFVFQKGKIVEEGSYDSLVDKKSYFYKLERGIVNK